MNIESKTTEEIKAHIIKMCDLYNKTGKDLYLKIKEQCNTELERRAQKKIESQQPEKPEQLPEPVMTGYIPTVERDLKNQHADAVQSEQVFNYIENRVVVGRASDVVVTVPVAEVTVGGKLRLLTQAEILGLLKTYFKGVATSTKMKEGKYGEAYAGEMGKTVYRLFDAWNLIYKQTNEGTAYPPMTDVFPGWKNASQAQKVAADVLWRWASGE